MPAHYFDFDAGIPLIKVLLDKEPQQLGIEITAGVLVSAFISYLIAVRILRYRYIKALRKKYPDANAALHSLAIAEEVFALTSRREFPCKVVHWFFFSGQLTFLVSHSYLSNLT